MMAIQLFLKKPSNYFLIGTELIFLIITHKMITCWFEFPYYSITFSYLGIPNHLESGQLEQSFKKDSREPKHRKSLFIILYVGPIYS